MADAPKRKKLEKTTQPSVNAQLGAQKFICCRCGTAYSRLKGYFPVSHSPMYRGSGYLPICSECVEDVYEQYRGMLDDDRAAIRRVCMKLDLYWNDKIYDMVERTVGVNSRIRGYIGKTNLIKYIDKTFDDTILEEELVVRMTVKDEFAQGTSDLFSEDADDDLSLVDQSTIDFWGTGYTAKFYDSLEKHYREWTDDAQITDKAERALYKKICLLEVTIELDGALGKAIDKNMNTLNTLLGSMNLKPTQQKDEADSELDRMSLGVGIQKWEYSRPLPETPKENKDVRGIIKNITTWYLGHVCKMVGLRNSYCKMYEDAMEELRVNNPEYDDEDDDSLLSDIFSGINNINQSDSDVNGGA